VNFPGFAVLTKALLKKTGLPVLFFGCFMGNYSDRSPLSLAATQMDGSRIDKTEQKA
jgi:hypothetical protein